MTAEDPGSWDPYAPCVYVPICLDVLILDEPKATLVCRDLSHAVSPPVLTRRAARESQSFHGGSTVLGAATLVQTVFPRLSFSSEIIPIHL